jgi:hypothetical protein
MKIIYYNINSNTVTLNFNKHFKQIRFIKMELLNDKNTESLMHSEEFEIKYNKDKSTIDLFISSQDFFILLIKEIDYIPVIYSYYLTIKNNLTINVPQLNIKEVKTNLLSNNINCPIKNENIFAKITKKKKL